MRTSGAASGEIMNVIIARAASGSLDTVVIARLDGHGLFRKPGTDVVGPRYADHNVGLLDAKLDAGVRSAAHWNGIAK